MAATVLTDEDIKPLVEELAGLRKTVTALQAKLDKMEGKPQRTRGDMEDARRILSAAIGRSEKNKLSATSVARLIAAGVIRKAQKTSASRNAPWTFDLAELHELTTQPHKLRIAG